MLSADVYQCAPFCRAVLLPPAVLTFSDFFGASVDEVAQQHGLPFSTIRPNQTCHDCARYFGNESSASEGGVAGYASWQNSHLSGAVTKQLAFSLHVMQQVPPGEIQISFYVKNPAHGQQAPALQMEINSDGVIVSKSKIFALVCVQLYPVRCFTWCFILCASLSLANHACFSTADIEHANT